MLCSVLLTGCYDAVGIEHTAYAIAIGIDKGDNDTIRLTLQFSMPDAPPPGAPPEPGAGQSGDTQVISVEAENIDAAINIINSRITRKVNLSHARVIIISQSLASQRSLWIYIYFSK